MVLSKPARLISGVILLTVPTIEYGGSFLLALLAGGHSELGLNEFQRSMFRAGHAHAGVLVILALVCQVLLDQAQLGAKLTWALRVTFPVAATLVSGGFFAAASTPGATSPNALIGLLWAGALLLAAALLGTGAGLVRSARRAD